MGPPLVLFHRNCPDGFTAAWVANKYLRNAELRPMDYTDEPPTDDEVAGRDVYVVDFSFKREVCERLFRAAAIFQVLDHHKTAESELRGLPYALFDMERSGAGLAWDYFSREPRPWLVDYVEDRDLWRFRLEGSPEVNAAVACTPMTLGAWNELVKQGPGWAWDFGRGALAFEAMIAKKAAETARIVLFQGYNVPFVNVQYTLASVTAGLLAENAPFAVAWFQKADGTFQYSLRSRVEHGVDVSEIAQRFGGGGHRNAAGFTLPNLLTREGIPTPPARFAVEDED
jgi:oligoribonuclease NrnB/cAMP/cGMP phosphodiesterase (DHH superfamily)